MFCSNSSFILMSEEVKHESFGDHQTTLAVAMLEHWGSPGGHHLNANKTSQGKFIGNYPVCQLHHTCTIPRCEFKRHKNIKRP